MPKIFDANYGSVRTYPAEGGAIVEQALIKMDRALSKRMMVDSGRNLMSPQQLCADINLASEAFAGRYRSLRTLTSHC